MMGELNWGRWVMGGLNCGRWVMGGLNWGRWVMDLTIFSVFILIVEEK